MPISEGTARLYLQLGVSGAVLFILLIFVVMLFKFFDSRNSTETTLITAQNSRIDKLCDKIDLLVSSYSENTRTLNEVLISNDKDQVAIMQSLERLLAISMDSQRRITRIDDRTYKCLGDTNRRLDYDCGSDI